MKIIYQDKKEPMRRFINRIQFTQADLEEYYCITPETAKLIKDTGLDCVEVSDEAYKVITCITKSEKNLNRVVITPKLRGKLKKLDKGWDFLDIPEILGISKRHYKQILTEEIKLTKPVIKDRIEQLYTDLVVKSSETLEDDKCPEVNIDKIYRKDREIELAKNRAMYKPLQVGKTYRIYEKRYASLEYDKVLIFEGLITKEYRSYFLGEHNGRVVTFLKNSLYEKDTIVKEVADVKNCRLSESVFN